MITLTVTCYRQTVVFIRYHAVHVYYGSSEILVMACGRHNNAGMAHSMYGLNVCMAGKTM